MTISIYKNSKTNKQTNKQTLQAVAINEQIKWTFTKISKSDRLYVCPTEKNKLHIDFIAISFMIAILASVHRVVLVSV